MVNALCHYWKHCIILYEEWLRLRSNEFFLVQGVWVSFQGGEYLLVGQEPSQTEAGVLALYKYDYSLSRMVLVS